MRLLDWLLGRVPPPRRDPELAELHTESNHVHDRAERLTRELRRLEMELRKR